MKQRKPNKRKQAQAERRKAEKAKAPKRYIGSIAHTSPTMGIAMALAAMQIFEGRRHDR